MTCGYGNEGLIQTEGVVFGWTERDNLGAFRKKFRTTKYSYNAYVFGECLEKTYKDYGQWQNKLNDDNEFTAYSEGEFLNSTKGTDDVLLEDCITATSAEKCITIATKNNLEYKYSNVMYKSGIYFKQKNFFVWIKIEKPREAADQQRLIELAKILLERINTGKMPANANKKSGPISAEEKQEWMNECAAAAQTNPDSAALDCYTQVAIASDDISICKNDEFMKYTKGNKVIDHSNECLDKFRQKSE